MCLRFCMPVWCSDKLARGRKVFIYGSCIMLAAGNFGLIFSQSLTVVIIISSIIGIGNGAYLAMDSALAIDCT